MSSIRIAFAVIYKNAVVLTMAISLCAASLIPVQVWGVNLTAPPSLKTVPIPEPPNLGLFLKSDPFKFNAGGFPVTTPETRAAAIALGKALFWDMQVGSDGIQACASCHFHAGVDNRVNNTVNPGVAAMTPDITFQAVPGCNARLTPVMFPFVKFQNPEDRFSQILSDVNDVVGSQGVYYTFFLGQPLPGTGACEQGSVIPDPLFDVGGVNTRRVTGRNAPSVINAVFNFANFWDGRANNIFNGSNPFGDADPNAGVWVNVNGVPQKQRIRIPMASLASQAVGPPGSDVEMAFSGRSFPDIGRKMLGLIPLAKQKVHRNDSVLGPYATRRSRGLNTTYTAMIQAAFQDKYWDSAQTVFIGSNAYTQMEANFSLFFGLAVQMYEATLVSDDSPFDRFQEGDNNAMSLSAQNGLNIFLIDPAGDPTIVGGACLNCHGGSEFTNASVSHIGASIFGDPPEQIMEFMASALGPFVYYDVGYYDIGVRPIVEDLGRGGRDPFGYPLSFTDRAILVDNGTVLPFFTPKLPCGSNVTPCPQQTPSTRGAFKTPSLRNVELTGPYFHNGGASTLMQTIDHYTRGGSFHERNLETLHPDIQTIPALQGNTAAQTQLIDFLLALTDERVRREQAPFDHPELFVSNGDTGNTSVVANCGGHGCDNMIRIPAVGKNGLSAERRMPIGTFLNLDPHQP